MKALRNWMAVLTATAITATAIWVGVAVLDVAGGSPAYQTVATASGTQMVCPVSGCTASTCHGATGAPAPTPGPLASAGSGSAGSASGGSGSSGATQVMTCPVSGCTASTCHGATGSPPPGRAGGTGRYATQQDGNVIWE
jgi:hypothetical protein